MVGVQRIVAWLLVSVEEREIGLAEAEGKPAGCTKVIK
jgi:hypothetical protein